MMSHWFHMYDYVCVCVCVPMLYTFEFIDYYRVLYVCTCRHTGSWGIPSRFVSVTILRSEWLLPLWEFTVPGKSPCANRILVGGFNHLEKY